HLDGAEHSPAGEQSDLARRKQLVRSFAYIVVVQSEAVHQSFHFTMSGEDLRLLPLLLALLPIAEFLHVEQTVTGLDCISCAESAPRNLKKIKGVDSATFRTKDSVAVLEMKPGNTVPLAEIRDAVKRMGYTPAGAKVTVRGSVRKDGEKWILRVT